MGAGDNHSTLVRSGDKHHQDERIRYRTEDRRLVQLIGAIGCHLYCSGLRYVHLK